MSIYHCDTSNRSNFVISSALVVCTFLFVLAFKVNAAPSNIGWGGGGAFSSYIQFDGTEYLSSDVAGVWRKVDNSWQPYVEGLQNYNVTKLVSFNHYLVAITTDALFYSDGNGPWIATNIELDTYRGTTEFPVVESDNLMCIGSRSYTVTCVNAAFEPFTVQTEVESIKGLQLAPDNSGDILVYGGSDIYALSLADQQLELVKQYPAAIIAMFQIKEKTLVVTTESIYDLNDTTDTRLYSPATGRLVNVFAGNFNGVGEVLYIGQGTQWAMKLYAFELTAQNELQKITNIELAMDSQLPHRKYQKQLTKLLNIYVNDEDIWLTDYWGLYQVDSSGIATTVEISGDAINTVATDLIVTPGEWFISTMDGGVVRADITDKSMNTWELLNKSSMRGHTWSMLYDGNTLSALLSPWENPNDYILTYSTTSGTTQTQQLTNYTRRSSLGTFWGQSYSRQLVDYNGLLSLRDGQYGGLVVEGDSPLSGTTINVGANNRVFRALTTHNGLLYAATCEGDSMVYVYNQTLALQEQIPAPEGFCPMTVYEDKSRLYYLGAKNDESAIYTFADGQFEPLFSTSKGSSFYAMAIDPKDANKMVIATTTWSNDASSAMFVSRDGGKSFVDKSCLLTHKNGVTKIVIDNKTAFIQQKVGGIVTVETKSLFAKGGCSAETTKGRGQPQTNGLKKTNGKHKK